jgi:recombination protein RecT
MNKIAEVKRKLADNWKSVEGAVPKGATASKITRIAINALASKKELSNCSTESIIGAIIQAVQVGIEPDDATGRANLIKRGSTCNFELTYKGVIDLAFRSGIVDYADTKLVREKDEIRVELGTEGRIDHTITFGQDRGEIIGAYAIIGIRGSSRPLIEIIDKEDIEKFRSLSKSPSWKMWPGEMVKKCVLKRAFKRSPCSSDFRTAMHYDDEAESSEKGVPITEIFPEFGKKDSKWTEPSVDENEEAEAEQ